MEDLLLLKEQFTAEEYAFGQEVQQFAQQEAAPLMADAYEQAHFPVELIPKIAALGLLGGRPLNAISYGLACQALEWADSSLRSFVSVQNSLSRYCITRYGTEEQQQHWLPAMARGEAIVCFGLSELEAGSDPASLKTTATPVTGGWRLQGSKMWITSAPLADAAIIWAQTEQGMRAFLVEKDTPGFSCGRIEKKLSMRISATGWIELDNCVISKAHYLPGSEKGIAAALSCLNQARYSVAWGVMGAAQCCYETALHYTQTRQQFQQPLANFQLVQKDLVDMYTEIMKAQCLNLQIGRLKDRQQASPIAISMAKMNACREALKVARMARNLLGAQGITAAYPVMRHANNLESVFTYEGTDNIHHLIIGKHLTGLDALRAES